MIPNVEKEGWHYLAVKKLPALLHEMNSKHKCDFYCLNCVHFFFRTENTFKSHEKVCKDKDFCGIVMPSQNIYADFESLILQNRWTSKQSRKIFNNKNR